MSLMGTLAKVAIGYAAARGVDKMAGAGGLSALLGGAQTQPGADGAEAQNPMQAMMAQMTGAAGGAGMPDLQGMLGGLMGGGAQAEDGDKGGLLSSLSGAGGGAGLAGMFAAMGGAAAAGGKGVGDMLDGFGKASATPPQAEAAAGLMLRAMIQAAKSDGDIDEAERAKILETIGEDADEGDIAFVQEQLAAPVDVEALARDTPEAMKMQVYAMSMMSIRVDTPAEKAYMSALADALGIDAQTAQMLNMQMGVTG